MTGECTARLERLLGVVLPVRDILGQRVEGMQVPAWCQARGWTSFLLGLDEATVQRAEAYDLAALLSERRDAPASLVELARASDTASELPRLDAARSLERGAQRGVKRRKQAQLSGLLAGIAGMASAAQRIVDVGSGSGHLTRLSAELFGRQALGLERDPERVAAAQRRADEAAVAVRFVSADARQALDLSRHDLALGLHACGELGERLLESAARAGCDVALVSCCLQKISAPARVALSSAAGAFSLQREHLGLSNLTAQPRGVEASIEVTVAARRTRYALARLLRARGVALELGAEMSGINRRRAHRGLRAVAELALAQRGLAPAGASELAEHEAAAAQEYAAVRRLSLPRSMLARAVEVLVSLDRAAYLEERGFHARVATLFERAVSPRNIGIFASRQSSRLPAPVGRHGAFHG